MISHGRLHVGPVERGLLEQAPFVVCADGGTAHARRVGRAPDLVVGDLDSLPAALRAWVRRRRIRTIAHPVSKDQTDTELAVREAAGRGHRDIVLLAALGGRLDHTLANVGLLARAREWGIRLRLVDGGTVAEVVGRALALDARVGDLVSLIPLDGRVSGIRTAGLRYPLRAETLEVGTTRGISNLVVAASPRVRAASGRLLAIRVRPRP